MYFDSYSWINTDQCMAVGSCMVKIDFIETFNLILKNLLDAD